MKRLLAAALCIALRATATEAENTAPLIELTATEQAYLAAMPIVRMCVDPDWAPFEQIDERGRHVGIAADLIQQVARRTGLKIMLYPTRTWEESLAASKAGRCQIMSFLNRTPERERWLDFTAPIFVDPNMIIAREDHPFVGDVRWLRDESVALPRGTMVEEHLRRDYPNLRIVLTESEPEAMTLVSERKADFTVRSLIVAAHAIRKQGLFNLKIAGQVPELGNQLRIGVIKSEPALRDILDKGVATLSAADREQIVNRHVSITVQNGTDYRLVWQLLAGGLVIALIGAFWMRKLSRLNRELARLSVTDRLTGIYNRMKLDEALAAEIQRCRRYDQALAIVLLDIDHFKRINDTYGHQAGDRALIDIARLLSEGSRETDVVGRWGGEEFMIVLPHTDLAGAGRLAEKMRTTIAAHEFSGIGQQTASFGVAAYRIDDQPNDLVARADAALYEAKHAGRNRVAGG
ncbi:diguanylate cyclase [Azonexus caeni]|uniref:diguanylate cyclase n=1 Tax=Azonexus caeni TaxID=266126 RepID=UPI003A8BD686